MSIYSEVNELQYKLFACIDQETGEIINDDFDALQILSDETTKNGISTLCKVQANLNAEIDALKAEEKRLADKRRMQEKVLDRLKRYMILIMQRAGKDKIEDGTFKVALRLSESVNILDEELLPDTFLRAVYEPDKKAIKEAIKNGQEVKGAELKTNTNIVIK